MNKTVLSLAVLFLILTTACQQQNPAKTQSDTGDHYKKLADLLFEKDYPTKETTLKLDEELYFQRAVQTYLWALPAVNMYAMKEGLGKTFGEGYQVMSVFEQRLKPNTVITTPNSDVIYGLGFADLSKTGPLVLEAPANLQGLLDDFWHRPLEGPKVNGRQFLADIGIPGPDKGKGGKYLIIPDDYTGEVDSKNYFVYKSKTNGVFIFVRGFFKSIDNVEPGVKSIEGIKLYPLNGAKKEMKFARASDVKSNALFAHDYSYFEMLNRFIQSDKVDKADQYMNGVMASLGIVKGKEFNPSAREKEILDLAAKTAWKMAKNIAANSDREYKGLWWKDRQWVAHGKTELNDFMKVLLNEEFAWRETNHIDVNAKAHMYINHYSISSGMISSVVGLGAKYAGAYKDSEGNFLTGENTYKITIPANVPAKLFWSLTAYEFSTASGLPAGQEYPSLNSLNDLEYNEDGSVTIYFAPEQPEGKKNWIKTIPDVGWFSLIRLYGPEQPFFDRKFKPGDFEKIK
ncbi:DUF1254 domain-containing protein [Marinilabiliaceae bacterium JC017]|nr:DUF1254 domain-containing protein [Marinilabiliaceae bacterium JC017]